MYLLVSLSLFEERDTNRARARETCISHFVLYPSEIRAGCGFSEEQFVSLTIPLFVRFLFGICSVFFCRHRESRYWCGFAEVRGVPFSVRFLFRFLFGVKTGYFCCLLLIILFICRNAPSLTHLPPCRSHVRVIRGPFLGVQRPRNTPRP